MSIVMRNQDSISAGKEHYHKSTGEIIFLRINIDKILKYDILILSKIINMSGLLPNGINGAIPLKR